MKKITLLLILISVSVFLTNCYRVITAPLPPSRHWVSIIPKPLSLESYEGHFTISPETVIYLDAGDSETEQVARYFNDRLGTVSGFQLPIVHEIPVAPSKGFLFKKSEKDSLGKEGYKLSVNEQLITCEANTAQGHFYGVQTLFQLLPPEIYSNKLASGIRWTIPCLRISDTPRYRWRGMLLDVSRHFFPKEFIKNFIDYLAMHKMNTFHWHLTDDQGWRIEIKRYPKLTEIGAWRVDREDRSWNLREPQKEGERATYGGFYTQEDIKEIVDYASSRFITIVPEVEMPGHCLAALASYPQYSSSGGPFTVLPGGVYPVYDVYCPGNEETFEFLQNILAEVIELFPSEYIHIGGDEVDKTPWKACPKCQARIGAEGLKNEEELQSYFVRRIEKFLNSKSKKLVGWDEILQGGLAPNAAVMSWRGTEGGIEAARQGHDVVMTPTSNCYFDYYQGDPEKEPLAIGGFLPLSVVYSFEPTPQELTPDEAQHILGVQANLWTEFVPTPEHAQYMTFPRIAAVSELGWSAKESKNWEDFKARMTEQFKRYELQGINWAKSAYAVRFFSELVPHKKELILKLETETSWPEIRFTLDGKDPTAASPRYAQPIHLKKNAILKAAHFMNGQIIRGITEGKFYIHRALGKPVRLGYPYREKYSGGGELGLTDGIRGSKSYGDGRWQGFEQDDLVASIDLGKSQKVKLITAGFLQDLGAWIFLPTSVEFEVSSNGRDFQVISTLTNDFSPLSTDVVKKDFSANLKGVKARFIKVHAKNISTCPEGHPGAGSKAWLFVDEIIVE
jgi:hexosaminidase